MGCKMVEFLKAKPVWADKLENEWNISIGLRCIIKKPEHGNVILKIAGASIYRVFLNGEFVGYGPSRAPHGYFRIDVRDITDMLNLPENMIAIEVAGYNVNSYYMACNTSFIQAEVAENGEVIAATGEKGDFEAFIMTERLQRVQRYSFQRPFIEVYNYDNCFLNWRNELGYEINRCSLIEQCEKKYLPQRVHEPVYETLRPFRIVGLGKIGKKEDRKEPYWYNNSITDVGETLLGYGIGQLETDISIILQDMNSYMFSYMDAAYSGNTTIDMKPDSYVIMEFDINSTGFLGCSLECDNDISFYMTFDELLTEDNDVDFTRMGSVNSVSYNLIAGVYELLSIEPYVMKAVKLIVTGGGCRVKNVHLRKLENPDADFAQFTCDNQKINRIFEAARETFKQNATDIYMDCPSRERAGWLCDSFFTARVEKVMTGKSIIETNFLENYILPEKFEHIPDGMLPMCYPSDHPNKIFIPNWSLWFIIELEEYLARTGDIDLISSAKEKVYKLLDYFKKFENELGLLEKLESWIFVEWSAAASFVQDINYPTNMLYTGAMAAASRIYNDDMLKTKAVDLKNTIVKMSYNGEFFTDNAVRSGSDIISTDNITETCQYYAFFFDIATPEAFPNLWNILVNKLGPKRSPDIYPTVHKANAFIGNYLRLEILSRYNMQNKIRQEIQDYFTYMVDKTGTLWEHDTALGSCNHGFASHAAFSIYRDILGISRIDYINKVVDININPGDLKEACGKMPIENDFIEVNWEIKDNRVCLSVSVPLGYRLNTTCAEGYEIKIKN